MFSPEFAHQILAHAADYLNTLAVRLSDLQDIFESENLDELRGPSFRDRPAEPTMRDLDAFYMAKKGPSPKWIEKDFKDYNILSSGPILVELRDKRAAEKLKTDCWALSISIRDYVPLAIEFGVNKSRDLDETLIVICLDHCHKLLSFGWQYLGYWNSQGSNYSLMGSVKRSRNRARRVAKLIDYMETSGGTLTEDGFLVNRMRFIEGVTKVLNLQGSDRNLANYKKYVIEFFTKKHGRSVKLIWK